jgi:ribonuclease HI
VNETINKQKPRAFFDGVCQGPNRICGLGFILHISEAHYFHDKAKMGLGSNNMVEFSALFALLRLVVSKDMTPIQVYGDSKLCID